MSIKILKDSYYYKDKVFRVSYVLNHCFGRKNIDISIPKTPCYLDGNSMSSAMVTNNNRNVIAVLHRLKLRYGLETWGIFFFIYFKTYEPMSV